MLASFLTLPGEILGSQLFLSQMMQSVIWFTCTGWGLGFHTEQRLQKALAASCLVELLYGCITFIIQRQLTYTDHQLISSKWRIHFLTVNIYTAYKKCSTLLNFFSLIIHNTESQWMQVGNRTSALKRNQISINQAVIQKLIIEVFTSFTVTCIFLSQITNRWQFYKNKGPFSDIHAVGSLLGTPN